MTEHADITTQRPLAGKVALVTGASRGIGKAISLKLAEQGADIAINYRSDTQAAEDGAEEVRAYGVEAFLAQGDVTRSEAATALVASVYARFGRLDILINNVGGFYLRRLDQMDVEAWRQVLDSNLNSVFYLCRAALPRMQAARSGRIINIGLSPADVVRAAPNVAAYAVAKTGVIVFTRSLAVEQARYEITVNCVSPGLIDNGMLPTEQRRWMERRVPMGRLGRMEEVAAAVAFLAAPEAGYISGANLTVSGGWDWENRPTDHDDMVNDLFSDSGSGV